MGAGPRKSLLAVRPWLCLGGAPCPSPLPAHDPIPTSNQSTIICSISFGVVSVAFTSLSLSVPRW